MRVDCQLLSAKSANTDLTNPETWILLRERQLNLTLNIA